ncbi:MAG TPA: thioredoxin TrxC [Burkholderiales bacterium]
MACAACGAANRVPADRLGEDPRCGKCKTPLLDGKPVALDEAGFDRFLRNSGIPVVVDFWAPWCGPCRMMAPAFEAAAAQLKGRARFAKLDTEAAPAVAARYGIRSIPTMIVFRGGREAARTSGAMDGSSIVRWVSSAA